MVDFLSRLFFHSALVCDLLVSRRCGSNGFALTDGRVAHLEHVEVVERGLCDTNLAFGIVLNVLHEGVMIGVVMLNHEDLARFVNQLLVGIFQCFLSLTLFVYHLIFLHLCGTFIHHLKLIEARLVLEVNFLVLDLSHDIKILLFLSLNSQTPVNFFVQLLHSRVLHVECILVSATKHEISFGRLDGHLQFDLFSD